MSEETTPNEIDEAREAAELAWKKAGTAIEETDKLGEEEPPEEETDDRK